jgi:hypothetical protein
MSKLIFETGMIGTTLKVYEDCVSLSPKGVMGFVSKGLSGERKFYYQDITSIQFKEAGWTAGFIEFYIAGHENTKKSGGAFSGIENENRFTFGGPTIGNAKKKNETMKEIIEYIEEQIEKAKAPITQTIINQNTSAADEIVKFKKLLDTGIITQEEFDKKKSTLLG